MYHVDEPIAVLEMRYNYQPRAFLWRGKTHAVYLVEQRWARTRRFWQRVERHYWRVRCQDGCLYDIYQDMQANTWHLDAIRTA